MINIIAAISKNNVIGRDGKLPWHYPADLAWFKDKTKFSTVVMGFNTWYSLGQKVLPHRDNIVLTRRNPMQFDNRSKYRLLISNLSLKNVLDSGWIKTKDVWIIGGARVYEDALSLAHQMFLTIIPQKIHGDNLVYFPSFSKEKWKLADKYNNPHNNKLIIQEWKNSYLI
jgi:dihydrofolate reductase